MAGDRTEDNLFQIPGQSQPDCAVPLVNRPPSSWKVMFVQECNLRCGYCCTGHGRYGEGALSMQSEQWMRLSELIVELAPPQSKVRIEFGGGETYLRFREAMLFLDRVRSLAAAKQIQVAATILTNGTVATPDQLQESLERKISLCFSIDGPAPRHDAFRTFANGRPTHHIALETYRRYHALVDGVTDPPGCTVSSVIAGDARLAEVADFWREQGVKQFKAIPAEPSRFLEGQELEQWQRRRDSYLQDLKVLAFSEAERLVGRDFERAFEGPAGLLKSWVQLKRGAPYQVCEAGYSVIAVDAVGTLFPCQGFIGFPERSIGDVHSGVNLARLREFQESRFRVQSSCRGCWARFLCEGGCCAGDPENDIVLNSWKGCEFSMALVEIAVESYHRLQSHSAAAQGSPA